MNPARWKQIDNILSAALELTPEKRSAFLDKACAEDIELRNEVETLLSSDHKAGDSIEQSPTLVAADLLNKHHSIDAGTLLAERYEIVAAIGAGGMGEVYRAKDLRLDREVAIKVLPEHLANDPNALSRFEREAKAVAALSHPNILDIYDFVSDQSMSFAVMKLLEGETLRQRINSKQFTWTEAIEIALPIAEGLSAAHSKGVIHRDLKPENIFLTSEGQVKILDFGLAQRKPSIAEQEHSTAQTRSELTKSGVIIGTIPYMSPEQVRGDPVDPRTDIFSFGSLLYELISGKNPFARKTPAETIAAILNENPAPVLQVPVEVNQIIQKCIQKNLDQRFQTSEDITLALKNALHANAIQALPMRLHLAARWFLFLLMFVIIVASIYFFTNRNKPFHSLAIIPFTNVSGNPDTEYLSDGIAENLITTISQLPNLKVMAHDTVFTYKNKQVDPRKVGNDLHVEAVVTGRVLQQADNLIIYAHLVNAADGTELWGQRFNRRMADVVKIQEEISDEISKNLRFKLTGEQKKLITKHHSVNPEAYQLYLKGRYHWYKFTPDDYEKSIQYFQQAIQKNPEYALPYAGLADCYVSMAFDGLIPPATACKDAKAATQKINEIDSDLPEAHYTLGSMAAVCDWDPSKALKEYRRSIELNPNLYYSWRFLGFFLRRLGRWDEAITEGKKSQEVDPLSPETTYALGGTYYWSGNFDAAMTQYKKAIDLDPNYAKGYDGLADVYAKKKMFAEAIINEQKYLRLAGDDEGADTLGKDFQTYGYQKARQLQFERALELWNDVAKDQYVSPIAFVVLYTQLNNKDQAFFWLEKAYQERSPWLLSLNTDPQFESLRTDPRFTDLLKRIGIPR